MDKKEKTILICAITNIVVSQIKIVYMKVRNEINAEDFTLEN